MRASFPATSLPFAWQGKFFPCQPQNFPAARAGTSYPSVGIQKDFSTRSSLDVQLESIFFPCFPVRQGKTAGARALLDRDALRQIAGLVDVGAFEDGGVVGEQLDRDRVEQRRDERIAARHGDAKGEA